jgi:hypothetical protein
MGRCDHRVPALRRALGPCVLAIACAGCNVAFGLSATKLAPDAADQSAPARDRDRDNIPDPEDDCIAGIADRRIDWEGDGIANEDDPCPFEYESTDGDGDGVYDDCDPFPASAGDHRRCVMAFQSATINLALWRPRAGDEAAWDLIGVGLRGGPTGTLLAEERVEAPTTTSYELHGYPPAPATEAAITLWLRAGEVASPADVGCEVRGTTTTTTLTIVGTRPPVTQVIARPLQHVGKLRATIAAGAPPGMANVRCGVRFYSDYTSATVSGEVVLPEGRFGLGVEATTTMNFQGLMILDRDDHPAL